MKHNLKRAAVALLLFLLSMSAYLSGLLDSSDHFITDHLYTSYRRISPNIFIIGIDSDSLNRYGPWGSWSRQLTADLIQYLNEDPDSKPTVIGIDILFSGNTTDREDGSLAEAVRNGKNVVLASQAVFSRDLISTKQGTQWDHSGVQSYEQPFDALRSVASNGFMNIFTDSDSVVRHGLYQFEYNGERLLSFSGAIADAYTRAVGLPPITAPPLDSNGEWHIPFAGKPGEFFGSGTKGTSWVRVMDGEIPRELFADSIVLVGPYSSGMMDHYFTSSDRSNPMYGVEIHANMLQSLLEGSYKNNVPGYLCILVVLVLSALLYITFCRFSVRVSTIATLSACGLYFVTALWLFQAGWIIPVLYPLLTFILIYLALLITNSAILTIEKASLYDQMHHLFINSIRTIANAIDAKDPYTRGHCQRVADYSLLIGQGLHLSSEDLADLEYAALLHDVGKIGISDNVLKKNGPLTETEYKEMKTHPLKGGQILEQIEEFRGHITDGAKYHHERFDGKGYCEGLSGMAIPLFGRIIAIADAYDAMTHNRPYRRHLSRATAVAELRNNAGTQFDPQLTDLFIELISAATPEAEEEPASQDLLSDVLSIQDQITRLTPDPETADSAVHK